MFINIYYLEYTDGYLKKFGVFFEGRYYFVWFRR